VFCALNGELSAERLICAVSAAALAGFLAHNWHPARAFMGDVGSTFIGYTFACLAVIQAPGILRSTNFFVLLVLMLPILFDATFTLLVRFLRGEKWYLPHRQHLFQRLHSCGYGHGMISLAYGMITLYLGAVLVLIQAGFFSSLFLIVVLFLLPFGGLYVWVKYSEWQFTGELEFVP